MEEKPKKNKIILVGYRATGKTTVAQALADRWSFGWVDLDVWIEEYAGTSIAEIFAKRGEPFFRDLEAQVVAVDAREIGDGKPGPLTARILSAFGEFVKNDDN